MNRTLILLSLLCCFAVNSVYCQQAEDNKTGRNIIFVEALGMSATPISINYDRVLKEVDNSTIDLNLGFGFFPASRKHNRSSFLGIPLYINFSTGNSNHHLDLGFGLTYNSGLEQQSIFLYEVPPVPAITESLKALYGSFRIGYKYQKREGGLFIRAGFTPLFKLKTFSEFTTTTIFYKLFGLGIGYTF